MRELSANALVLPRKARDVCVYVRGKSGDFYERACSLAVRFHFELVMPPWNRESWPHETLYRSRRTRIAQGPAYYNYSRHMRLTAGRHVIVVMTVNYYALGAHLWHITAMFHRSARLQKFIHQVWIFRPSERRIPVAYISRATHKFTLFIEQNYIITYFINSLSK